LATRTALTAERRGLRGWRGGLALLPLAAALVVVPGAIGNPVQKAAFTTVNEDKDGSGHCKNGNPDVNCNIYDGKDFVWLNGGPTAGALDNGTYVFAVVAPGGQGGNDGPNDCTPSDLSDFTPCDTSDTGAGDSWTHRVFSISDHTLSYPAEGYPGGHDFFNNKIRLMPYDNATNNGGVYIMAICSLEEATNADQTADETTNPPGVDPSDCKYDAFKVHPPNTTPPSENLTATKSANPSFSHTYKWDITKDVDKTKVTIASGGSATFDYTVSVTHDDGTDGGWQVDGAITINNPNLFDVAGVDVTSDAVDNGGTCAITDTLPVTVPGGGSTDVHYTCSYASAPSPSNGANTATITWPDIGSSTTTTPATADFNFDDAVPAIVDGSVSVTDTLGGTLGTATYLDANPKTFTYSQTFSGDPGGTCTDHPNTATIDQTDQSASQSVTVCVGANLTASKTATPAFTRRYLWRINKAVDKTRVTLVTGSATFNYTVTVTQTGFTDSGWGVTGTITVNNPNDFEAVPVNISDSVNNGGVCSIAGGGTGVFVPAATDTTHPGQVSKDYSCTWSTPPSSASGTNTGSVSWDSALAHTPLGSATGTVGFSFTTPSNPINKTITVTDTYAGTLGTATATDGAPFTIASFLYWRTIPAPATGCLSYPNTATIVETNQTSSQNVTVCKIPPATGALTMGFWKNKNGQNIIKGDGSTNGVCKLTLWLWQYAPFQDLAANASCTAVATYVNNIIGAATCGGSSCNAMLKAQMLATALDVYFSDLALGGNKIGAPNGPIGNFTISLSVICQMIDGSNGSTCSGTYYNVSSAFGSPVPPCMTVSAMLAYAASQSNPGGSSWYAQYKPTQVKAKDAFDSINNVVAFQC